ncbi:MULTISPECIES: PilN domain-containing protein [unclassified Bradyrhizobium]|uniref:PilN domain-containing protein n=1 Tax=unclassified Bradyrhizobium TaxID=2631580 RepID=UPI00247A743B|nr:MULTISPECIES: PilN domain-containing protein [unclassified Bradyrhizobium]WGS18097.1 PilN domain-containing protein [Bradyrhizobium sp. ISRA463]WGS24910.1 PilN domain-containing protein [Bradyrhizobium sp. ISRA464]
MALISDVKLFLTEWIDAVGRAIDAIAGRFMRAQRIQLAEGHDGAFTATAINAKSGADLPDLSFRFDSDTARPALPEVWKTAFRASRIEALLRSDHIMTHQLDFPSKAADFLDGMIKAQVDRLTPWSVSDAVFGWGAPTLAANDRIEVSFAATSREKVAPVLQFAETVDAASVAILVPALGDTSTPIKLMDRPLRSVIGAAVNVPRLLRVLLLSTALAAAASLLINAYLGGSLQSELGDLQQRIAQRRAALRLGANGSASGLGLLAKRKQSTPSSVMVLEAISRALPDSTYVTELRIEGDKIQIVGMTQDAPSLIRLIEQSSPQFTRATFFAPTTHAANEPGERFHIEAHITAYFGSGS